MEEGPSIHAPFTSVKNNSMLAANTVHSREQHVCGKQFGSAATFLLSAVLPGNGAELGQPEPRAHSHVGLGVRDRKLEGISGEEGAF